MSLHLLLVLLLQSMVWAEGEGRVRLNSITTVILREGHGHNMNDSTRVEDYTQFLQCISDMECSEGAYCHAPSRRHAFSRCQVCRRRKRRCHRDGMCCPGNRCSNSICVPDFDSFLSQSIPDGDGGMKVSKKKGWRRDKIASKHSSVKGQVGDPCLRSSDCSQNLCCARHFWARICKPVLQEGQVCTRHRRKGHHGLELFQRCDCGEGLGCRTLRGPALQPSLSASRPSSSSSTLMLAKAKLSSSPSSVSRHNSPHTSLLASSASSSSSSKARLHVCQRN